MDERIWRPLCLIRAVDGNRDSATTSIGRRWQQRKVAIRSKTPSASSVPLCFKVLNWIVPIRGMPLVTALILVHVLIFSRSLLARRI